MCDRKTKNGKKMPRYTLFFGNSHATVKQAKKPHFTFFTLSRVRNFHRTEFRIIVSKLSGTITEENNYSSHFLNIARSIALSSA